MAAGHVSVYALYDVLYTFSLTRETECQVLFLGKWYQSNIEILIQKRAWFTQIKKKKEIKQLRGTKAITNIQYLRNLQFAHCRVGKGRN